ncbi:right-handed parallel beta-helix repeat-containing protein [Longitalea luteola]|uniref:right-handed parallel beta-helix repeat-containing protein n=1 Tax=Longitalea luteola TaxID=2812563 RepID=UPI001A965124|nr:right-handed parallel beta-helix repeat-containing protein [Longitalea luteola]
MKTLFNYAVLFSLFACFSISVQAADIYVAPTGSDANPGTEDKPMASVAMALRKAREMRRLKDPAVANGIHIIVANGVYTFWEPLFVRPEDSGTPESPTIIEAAPGARPVFSGGMSVKGWRKAGKIAGLPAAAQGKVWVADAPVEAGRLLDFRQLWINDQKAIRARDRNADSMNRILSWNHQTEQCWIPTPKTPGWDKAAGLEMVIHQWWAIAILRIKSVSVKGDSALLSFHQPESRIQSEHPWPAPWISQKTGNSAFFLTNAIQFLDEPGEWYLDVKRQQIIYWPRSNEDLRTAQVTAPYLQNIVRVEGTIDNPVAHVSFKGIDFKYTTWLRPSQAGHVPLQAGMYLLDAYKLKIPGTPDKRGLENQGWIGRQPAGVELQYVRNTGFERCNFSHMAATGLDYIKGTQYDTIIGCTFRDIGGTAIQAGYFSDPAFETHLPYNPADSRELCRKLTINNCFITNCANEDWGCVGISAGYVQGINIEHNELSDLPYSGICVGWGWTKTINAMRNNRVHANLVHHYAKHMYDVGGLYTLSAQPGSVISENYVHTILKAPYAHDPNHFFYMYLDEGSAYITLKDNYCEEDKFMKNSNGPGNTWDNNGPKVADSIKNRAGLEEAYKGIKNVK